MQAAPAPIAAEFQAVGQRPLMRLEIIVGGAVINICNLTDPATGIAKNYLKDISFTSGGARMTPDPIAGKFSAIINNKDNIFHPNHPTSSYTAYFRAGREVRIWLGGNYTPGGIKYWQRITGYMDQPDFSSDTYELTITGLDYMMRLVDMKFTKEVVGASPGQPPTPIDNYWGDIIIYDSEDTAEGFEGELYALSDAMDPADDGGPPFGNVAGWAIPGAIAFSATNILPRVPGEWVGLAEFMGFVGTHYIRRANVVALTAGTWYRYEFWYRRQSGSGDITFAAKQGATFLGSKTISPPNAGWHQDHFDFLALATANLSIDITIDTIHAGGWRFDDFSVKEISGHDWHRYSMHGLGCTGIYYVELKQDGVWQPVWAGKQGSPGEGWYYDDTPGAEQFYFDEEKNVDFVANGLRIYYFTTQQAQNVVADILVKAYPTVYGAAFPANRVAALNAMKNPVTGVGIDRVWFDAGSTYINAIRMICERCNWRFYFDWAGIPVFIPAPGFVASSFTFNHQLIKSPHLYQDRSEIWNRIVIEGEKRAELTGWEDNMPSEVKGALKDATSIGLYGEHTLKIRNHLFQTQASIYDRATGTGMCATLLAAHKDPKWYFDFETPYNAVPLELGDTVEARELLDITLPFAQRNILHTCLIRNVDVSRYNITYKCEMEEKSMIELLASIDDIDLNALGETSLYTVPAGRGCIITGVVMRNADGAVGTAEWSCGFNDGSWDDVIANAHRALDGATNYNVVMAYPNAVRGAATEIFKIDVNTAEGISGTLYVTVDVFGYLY